MKCMRFELLALTAAFFGFVAPTSGADLDLLNCFDDRGGPAGLDFGLHRRADGDSLRLVVAVSGGRGGRVDWEAVLGEGLQALEGQTSGLGGGDHAIEVKCLRWGEFSIVGRVTVQRDSLNSGVLARELRFRATPESLVVNDSRRTLEKVWTRDGIRYVQVECIWLPLDTGEPAGSPLARALDRRPAPLRAVPARSAALGAGKPAVEVRVIVAVDRAGRVKATRYMGMADPPARAVIDAALAAAREWTFPPATSEGHPASALYEIWVPVTPP